MSENTESSRLVSQRFSSGVLRQFDVKFNAKICRVETQFFFRYIVKYRHIAIQNTKRGVSSRACVTYVHINRCPDLSCYRDRKNNRETDTAIHFFDQIESYFSWFAVSRAARSKVNSEEMKNKRKRRKKRDRDRKASPWGNSTNHLPSRSILADPLAIYAQQMFDVKRRETSLSLGRNIARFVEATTNFSARYKYMCVCKQTRTKCGLLSVRKRQLIAPFYAWFAPPRNISMEYLRVQRIQFEPNVTFDIDLKFSLRVMIIIIELAMGNAICTNRSFCILIMILI